MKQCKNITICLSALLLIIAIAGLIILHIRNDKQNKANTFINNPFSFTILKNYSDNFASIGNIINTYSKCPLLEENIADSSFCFLRTVEYDGLTINIFSFDVIQSGTAEYIISKNTIYLKNGLSIGSTKEEVIRKIGKPYKVQDNLYIWKSYDLNNYLVFTFLSNTVSKIRWHEEREPKYKNKIVWNTRYD